MRLTRPSLTHREHVRPYDQLGRTARRGLPPSNPEWDKPPFWHRRPHLKALVPQPGDHH